MSKEAAEAKNGMSDPETLGCETENGRDPGIVGQGFPAKTRTAVSLGISESRLYNFNLEI